ncbi:DUF7266 family protein [Methanolobus profundi]|uniref:Archaeal Type IV pilin N-terminal domain-containing protein n=1 Tax=Methanolobus profundi TaxID=487685 RepID=A0A1I4SSQ0_9EURY|nr:hypothetical protein [Methanolobus profundi]SFM67441.1 hypothetical protein SAMN04488696_1992 [Methanolobus profundi]
MTKRLINDERAVSISVGTMLIFAITVTTMIIVISSFYTMIDREGDMVMRNQFEIHGNDLALQISNIDTTVQIVNNSGGKVENVSFRFSLPQTIVDEQYSIEFKNDTNEIIFESKRGYNNQVKVSYVTSEVDVASTTLFSGPDNFEFYYNPDSNLIEVRNV